MLLIVAALTMSAMKPIPAIEGGGVRAAVPSAARAVPCGRGQDALAAGLPQLPHGHGVKGSKGVPAIADADRLYSDADCATPRPAVRQVRDQTERRVIGHDDHLAQHARRRHGRHA
jgi:hypothetical protein